MRDMRDTATVKEGIFIRETIENNIKLKSRNIYLENMLRKMTKEQDEIEQDTYERAYKEGYDKGYSDGNFCGKYANWIPTNEKLPNKYGRYLVTCNDTVITAHYDEKGWEYLTRIYPTAWKPLPKPYCDEEEK